jgi:hypothetical protein
MPDWMSRERRELIRSFGAEIVGISRQQGGFLGSIQMAEEFAANGSDVFLPRQFSNDDKSEAPYQTTGPQTWSQPAASGLVWNLLLQADPRGLASSVEQQDCIESSAITWRSPFCAVVAHNHLRTVISRFAFFWTVRG